MGNSFAYLVLFVWPVIVLVSFRQRRGKYSVARTTAWMLLLGIMFPPAAVVLDAPMFPPLGKCRLTTVAVHLALMLFHSKELLKQAPWHQVPRVLLVLNIVTAYLTVDSNRDPLQFGSTRLAGLTTSDTISLSLGAVFDVYMPFSIAQRVFRTERDLRDLLDVCTRAMLVYIPFILYELRMAPVLHDKIYGFSPFGFEQAYRAGGYRPAVFMEHGLALAMFIVAAYAAARGEAAAGIVTKPLRAGSLVLIGTVIVLLCKTLAALIYAAVAFIFIRQPVRTWALSTFLFVITISVAAYPWSRIQGKFPTYMLEDWAASASAERADSLQFRFRNEDILLVHGLKRSTYGWGGNGRNRVYDEDGRDVCVTDGLWIMWFGSLGYSGLVLNLAAVLLPLLRAAKRLRKVRASALPLFAVLAVVSAALAVDILPNARFDYLAFILSGAMWTLSDTLTRPLPKPSPTPARSAAPIPVPAA